MRADWFRIFVLKWFGGIYADTDTKPMRRPSQWVTPSDLTAWSAHLPVGKSTVNLIVGVESDTPSTKSDAHWRSGYAQPLTILQWAMASAAHHPVLGEMLTSVQRAADKIAPEERHRVDALKLTGPARWTTVVRKHLEDVVGGFRWEELTGREDGGRSKLVADVLVLPITGFSAKNTKPKLWQDDSSDEDDAKHSYREQTLDQLENPWAAPVETFPASKEQSTPSTQTQGQPRGLASLPTRLSSLPTPPPGSPDRPGKDALDFWDADGDGDLGLTGLFVESPKVVPRLADEGGKMMASPGATTSLAHPRPWDVAGGAVGATGDLLLEFLGSGPSPSVETVADSVAEESGLPLDISFVAVAAEHPGDEDARHIRSSQPRQPQTAVVDSNPEKEALIRQVLALQTTLRVKLHRATLAKSEHARQHGETLVLHQYMTNLMAASRRMDKENEAAKNEKPAKKQRLYNPTASSPLRENSKAMDKLSKAIVYDKRNRPAKTRYTDMAFQIPTLGKNDEDILNHIFNPEAPLPTGDDDASTADPSVSDDPLSTIPAPLLAQLKALEAEAVVLSEKGDVPAGIAKLTEAITLHPPYASAYNNRAQAHRIQKDNAAALADLKLAIEYGKGNADILKQAYTQRAIVRKAEGDEQGSESDFAQGARYGNEVAKVAVKNNPYAKM
ncbi:hypothetical protein HKX48_002761 [Thoreauomyces humboldtii]|nr:hypothetical protein HKX48_002761 [Thoreauomyces humboldtii]